MKTTHTVLRKIPLLLILLAVITLFSCRETKEAETEEPEATTKVETKATTPDTNSDVAMNPAHGQPGHRCDIPVGAPLNSESNTTTTSQSPVINSGSTSNSGKVNPAHGQPGHRCDIKVGDPL